MTFEAKLLADSLSPDGVRLSTFCITLPRIVLSELNTHRTLCLAGDAELEFDLPSKQAGGFRKVFRMRIDEFVDKWLRGARRYAANPKRQYDMTWVDPSAVYTAEHAASCMGMSGAAPVNAACRQEALQAERAENGRTWLVTGQALLDWRQSVPEHTRFDIRARLAGMRIRQLNEQTGDIQLATVTDAIESGVKNVFEVIAGDYSVAGSADHLVLTANGWKTIAQLSTTDFLVVRKFGKREEDKVDPMRLQRIGGVWRSQWQREERARLVLESPLCRRCQREPGEEVHHLEPVYLAPHRAFDKTNITFLCVNCHDAMHEEQGWQGGTYLYGALAPVEQVYLRGQESTYDLTISGSFPNFLANGVVVHNSRNSASSRAMPVAKMIKSVMENPYTPSHWGKNQKGMQAEQEVNAEEAEVALYHWLQARNSAVDRAQVLLDVGIHKQITNRLLEPWMWHTCIVTGTEWSNFFHLRNHPAAHPCFAKIARMMQELYESATPDKLDYGEWHLPLIGPDDYAAAFDEGLAQAAGDSQALMQLLVKISAARCARISYLTHENERALLEDVQKHDALLAAGHMSPFEHQARPLDPTKSADLVNTHVPWENKEGDLPWSGNLRGWVQYRKTIPNEADILAVPR